MTESRQPLDAVVDVLVGELLDGLANRRTIAGIVGPPGAGKSTLAAALVEAWRRRGLGEPALLPMDGFHLSSAQLDRLGRGDRKGAPDTFDVDGFVVALERVRAAYGVADVYTPDFDRAVDEPLSAGLLVPAAAQLIITEGNYLALGSGGWESVRGLVDRLYYLDVPATIRRPRLVQRHIAGGRTAAAAAAWVDAVDDVNADLIAASRDRCDRVVRCS